MIDKMIHKKKRVIILKSIFPIHPENTNTTFYKLNYDKEISNQIVNIIKKYDIRTTYINSNNIGKILLTIKIKGTIFLKVVSITLFSVE